MEQNLIVRLLLQIDFDEVFELFTQMPDGCRFPYLSCTSKQHGFMSGTCDRYKGENKVLRNMKVTLESDGAFIAYSYGRDQVGALIVNGTELPANNASDRVDAGTLLTVGLNTLTIRLHSTLYGRTGY